MSSKSKKNGMKVDRTLVVVDLENACGSSQLIGAYHKVAHELIQNIVGNGAVVYVIATGPAARRETPDLPFEWPTSRWLVGHGRDGADRELTDVLLDEPLARRSQRVVVVSGDHRFAPALHQLALSGVETTVVSRAKALSRECRLAAINTVVIPEPCENICSPLEAA